MTEVCVTLTLYGGSAVTLVLMGDFVTNIATYFAPGIPLRHRHLVTHMSDLTLPSQPVRVDGGGGGGSRPPLLARHPGRPLVRGSGRPRLHLRRLRPRPRPGGGDTSIFCCQRKYLLCIALISRGERCEGPGQLPARGRALAPAQAAARGGPGFR